MSIFKRLFGIGSAEVNSALDKLEDPVKMTEQGIRDLKQDLTKSMQGLAEVKALTIRTRKEYESNKDKAEEYERKAILLLQKAESGQLVPEEADRLASECLSKKEQAMTAAQTHHKMLSQNEGQVAKMEQNIQSLKSQISKWENEAKTLKARAKVSEASAKLNKTLANVDSSSTINLLERMKQKVEEKEALAESYGDIASLETSVDDEINKAIGPGTGNSTPQLEALKAKLKLNQNNPE
ncbi:PspA/IM30 family protein [Sediminitomix flava]|uniref:Phage shock protein A (PspA) family protein n=1 Tax=Sediminitomix flava TaxID=379075 RepID=A0A315Z6Y1_SEDFL|nr:PspA/IM30 family protein [Sediminitomix flava]PWJ40167.1 phage shock protein A (PspA) family protein [Sediminitomix flava]